MAGNTTFGIAMRNFAAAPREPDAQALIEYGVRMEELGFEGRSFVTVFDGCTHEEHLSWTPSNGKG